VAPVPGAPWCGALLNASSPIVPLRQLAVNR
jgi:hypothetical protein